MHACECCFEHVKPEKLTPCHLKNCSYTMCNDCINVYTKEYACTKCPNCQRRRFYTQKEKYMVLVLAFFMYSQKDNKKDKYLFGILIFFLYSLKFTRKNILLLTLAFLLYFF